MHSKALFPLFLSLEGRRVVVVGGGEVGARKVRELLDARAIVTVIDPSSSSDLETLAADPNVTLHRRPFAASDLDDAWLVVAATNDATINASVADAAHARRIFCNAVDDPANASAFFASLLRRPPLTVAISTDGEAPALARLLREVIESVLPEEEWIERARALRARWRARKTPMRSRFGELVRAIAARSP